MKTLLNMHFTYSTRHSSGLLERRLQIRFHHFPQMSSLRFALFRDDSNLGSWSSFHRKTTSNEQFTRSTCSVRVFRYHISQLCRRMAQRTIVPHSTRLGLSAIASRPDFLSFRPRHEDKERARASKTPRQSTTKAAGNLSRFRLPILQIQLSEQNFFQAPKCVDTFVIAVCRSLSLCCR